MTRHEYAAMTVAIHEDEMEIGFKGVKYTKTIFNWFKLALLQDPQHKDFFKTYKILGVNK